MSALPCITNSRPGVSIFALSGQGGGGVPANPDLTLSTLTMNENTGLITLGANSIFVAPTGALALSNVVSISSLSVSTINNLPFEPGGIYPLVSTIGMAIGSGFASGYSTFMSTFTGNAGHTVVPFTDNFQLTQNHKYSLSWSFGNSNVDGEPSGFLAQKWLLNVSGGGNATYSPPAGSSGANTVDGTEIGMTYEFFQTGPSTANQLLFTTYDYGNPSTISTFIYPPLTGSATYNVVLTDFGPTQ